MKYKARKFNQQSYDWSDDSAKARFIRFLEKRGHTVLPREEDYYHDVVTKKDGEFHYFELEYLTNHPWENKEDFHYPSVSFLGRKERLHKNQPFYYVILCRENDSAVVCHSNDIFKDKYKQEHMINTSHRKGRDLFYRVPKDKCKFFKT